MKAFFQSISDRSMFYQNMFWGNAVSWLMVLIIELWLLTQQDLGNMGNIVFVFPMLPALLLIPVDFIVIPIYLAKRLHRKDRSDIGVQILSLLLLLLIAGWIVWSAQSR